MNLLGLRKYQSQSSLEKPNESKASENPKVTQKAYKLKFTTIPHKDKKGDVPDFLPPMSRSGKRLLKKHWNEVVCIHFLYSAYEI